jgi:hypothetical protein
MEYIGLPTLACSRCLCPGWSHHTPQHFALRPDISTAIFIPVTNAIESLHRGLRKIIKTRSAFPSDEAAMKLLYLALRNLGVHWKPAIEWRAAYAQFTIFFPRQPVALVHQGGLAFQRLAARTLKDDPSALNRPHYGRP